MQSNTLYRMKLFYFHPRRTFGRVIVLLEFVLCFVMPFAHADGPLDDIKEGIHKISEDIHNTFDDVFESIDDILETSTLAGQISPLMKRFLLTKAQRRGIWSGITHVAKFGDIAFLLVLGWALVPTLTLPYDRWISSSSRTPNSFRLTKTYQVANSLSQLSKLAILVYFFDMVKIALLGAGFDIPRRERLTHAFAYIVYTIWATARLSEFKKYLLCELTKESEGRLQVFNRLVDSVLFLCALFFILDILHLQIGVAMRGVVAFGSIGTLVFSLASKDIATNWLYGIILSASDRIYEGDSVRLLKSGFSGTVERLGWLETVLRGSDELMITVPNSQILSEQVCNLSRIHQSQVIQTLRFPYSDSDKLPQLLQDIKHEIRSSCPSVITDGSRPFRCYWTDYGDNCLKVVVDAHFQIKPVGEAYHENRQRVLVAIDQAVKKNSLQFCS